MSMTAGFEVVAELSKAVLQQFLDAAWDSSVIPHTVTIPSTVMFGPYQVADGNVSIPKAGLTIDTAPAANGVLVTLPSQIQVQIANPPLPSLSLFNLTANIIVTTPLGTINNTIDVGAILVGLPRNNVVVHLTSGNPIGPITLTMIQDYVHQKYKDGTIPATITQTGVSFGVYTADAYTEIFDDASNPNHQIVVSQPDPSHVKVLLPMHLRLSNIRAAAGPTPLAPMGVEAKIAITAPLVTVPGSITAQFSTATVDVEGLTPASGIEGSNYNTDKAGASLFGINLDDLMTNQIKARGRAIISSIGDHTVTVPTVDQIEAFIGDQTLNELTKHGNIPLWTPTPPPDSGIVVGDVVPKALADALAIGIKSNPNDNADPNTLTNFVPAGRDFAVAIDGAKVTQIIWDRIHRPEADGGFGPDFPHTPKTFNNVDGHTARLTSLDISLQEGQIHMQGDVTVVNAILGSIDVDASFTADAGLKWADNPDGSGTQMIQPFTKDTNVDLSLLAWILSFLLGFITLGLVGGIIALVVVDIVQGIANSVGGAIVRDQVSDQIKGIGAWPQNLKGIGTVQSRFEDPIDIHTDSIVFSGTMKVTSTFALTVDGMAESNGPYVVAAGSALQFIGGPQVIDTQYLWDFGDGTTTVGARVSHIYAEEGIYVAKLTTTVNQPGGVITRQFTQVRVLDVAPDVQVGPPMTVNEGQVVEYIASFTDPEWPDTHTAVFDFGDDSLPEEATVSETNNPPQAQGTVRAKHAYCDEGEYTITIKVRDDEGTTGIATLLVTVLNVPPTVDAGPDMFAYPCTPITLVAHFTDPGWCDTHIGFWEFGDCTPPHPAIIREKHKPPAGTGIAAAAHTYEHCGTYLAECSVIDDDGGIGRDTIAVRVVDVRNRHFEDGFRNRLVGTIANAWEPYAIVSDNPGLFKAEEFVVHSGQRSQRINGRSELNVGISQRVGANLGWDYQVSVWYHIDEHFSGLCRLGIDPTGDVDPLSSNVQWSAGSEQHNWSQLVGRVTATGHAITIFLENASVRDAGVIYVDDVALIPYPCSLSEPTPMPPPKEEKVCVDWQENEPREVGVTYQKNGFTFVSLSQQPLRIVTWGLPSGQGKLVILARGIQVQLPFVAERVVAHVSGYTKNPITLEAFDANGDKIGGATTTSGQSMGTIQELAVQATGITRVILMGGNNESLLVDLCAYRLVDNSEDSLRQEEL